MKVSKRHPEQEGAALVTAIFAILIATVIGFALYYSTMISFTVAVNDRDNTEALYLADAGVNHALALIKKAQKSQYSLILKAGSNPAPNSGDELSVPPSSGLWTAAESIPAGSATGGGVINFGAGGQGRYWVAVRNDAATGETALADLNGILIITSTGVGRDGATATVEVTVQDDSANYPGVLINGNAKVSGSVKISGANGILHANGNLEINGGPCADQYFSSSGTIIGSNKTKGIGCLGVGFNRPNQPVIPPPIYNIRDDFYGKTDYILGATGLRAGKVYDGAGNLIFDTKNADNKWTQGGSTWEWVSNYGLWLQSGNTIQNGSFYSEGSIAITANFGTSAVPARVSFIAEGFIYNGGKQFMAPAYQNFSLVAGTDIKLSGKLTQTEVDDLEVGGITYARDQINFSGTPTLRGTVIAANQADGTAPGCNSSVTICNLVPLEGGVMNISGNPTIIVDGSNIGGGAKIRNWREVRY